MFSRLASMNIYQLSVNILTILFDKLSLAFIRKSPSPACIAIIRLDSIGDFILWLDPAKELRELYPQKRITLICNQIYSDLARLLPYWDEVIAVDRDKLTKDLLYRFRSLRRIYRLRVETAIHPTYSREYLRADSLMRATCARQRIGSIGNLSNMTSLQKKISDQWYTQLLPASYKPMMELRRNAEFIRGLGAKKFTASIPFLPFLMPLPDRLILPKPYFVIFPGASFPGRQWPASQFGILLSELSAAQSWRAVLCGSREERSVCDQVIRASGMKATNLAGQTLLPELVEVIRGAAFLVSNETSAIHIAAATGTPSVCILGGGHYGRFLPYDPEDAGKQPLPVPVIHKMDCFGCNWKCTQPHKKGTPVPCISGITVEQVWKAVENILPAATNK